MIFYEPNKHFLKDVWHLGSSYTLRRIVRGVLLAGLLSLCITAFAVHFNKQLSMALDPAAFTFLGLVLSILLVFRTNSAYDRWWEARKLWGALVNDCRNLAIAAQTTFPAHLKAERTELAVLIGSFCIALKEHLRAGTKLEELIDLSAQKRQALAEFKHIPNALATDINALVGRLYASGDLRPHDHLNMRPHVAALVDILGACERIRKTPIPFSYSVFIRMFIMIYLLLLPFSLVSTFMWWTVPVVMVISFAFLGVELMASEIEDPFGLDCNDLPTGTIAHTIRDNVFEILEINHGQSEKVDVLYEKTF